MAGLLTKENIKRFNFYEFLALTQPFLDATSNLFSANLYIATQLQTFGEFVHKTIFIFKFILKLVFT